MDKDIFYKLGLSENSNLFKAYSTAYNSAKILQQTRFIITYTVSIALPILSIYNPSHRSTFSIFGGLWTLTAFFVTLREKDFIKGAAKLQDEFDSNIFSLPRNEILVGARPSEWNIEQLSSKYRGKEDVKNWYGFLQKNLISLNVLTCQRSNIIWDWRLRKSYFLSLLAMLVILFLGGVTASIFFKLTLSEYIISVFLPASSALVLGVKELLEHYDNYTSKLKLEAKLNSKIEKQKNGHNDVSEMELRQIQDVIFLSRKCSALVPTWYYNMKKKAYNKRMQAVINAV